MEEDEEEELNILDESSEARQDRDKVRGPTRPSLCRPEADVRVPSPEDALGSKLW